MGVLRRKSPLFRRKSSRNVSAIEAEVDYILQRSPFLLQQEGRRAQHEDVEAVPTFSRKECQTGSLLGAGSFSKVHAIIGFKLSCNSSNKRNNSKPPLNASTSSSEGPLLATPELSQNSRVGISQSAFDATGNARYAVKFVKKELTKKPPHIFRHAASDLIVEAKYLAALNHPNILKLRGIAQDGCSGFADGHDGFFVIVDRLEETLAERIQKWKQQEPRSNDLLTLQANYALQLANALAYLHDRRILFRDVKPANVGFAKDAPHTVQLFDFGLCRELPVATDNYLDDEDEAFEMSGAGTYIYMAPEILNTKCYNLKADVYSWAFFFHEMIALKRPFDEFTVEEHKEFVCEIGQRPSLTDFNLPTDLQTLLRQAWDQDATQRLTMRQVVRKLEPIVQEMEEAKRNNEEASQAQDEKRDKLAPAIPPRTQSWTRASLNRASLLGRQALDALSEMITTST